MTLPLLTLHQKIVKLAKDCKTSKRTQVKNIKKHNQGKDCKNITDEVCKENNFLISVRPVNKEMWRKLLPLPTREKNRLQQSCMGWPNKYNIYTTSCKTKEMLYRTTFVQLKSLIAIKLHTTRYNTIQQGGQTSATFHTTSKLYDVV